MALNKFMHPRNRYKNQPPDFAKLAAKYDNFAQHVSVSLSGKVSVDFKNPQALRSLTCTLLKEDFNVEIDVPLDRLVPTLPLRLNYIHWVEDLIRDNGAYRGSHIHGIDIGTGASCIYPLLGARLNEWHITATETDPVNVFYAKENIEKNNMNDKIKVIESSEDDIFSQVFEDNERQCYDFSMCNPPFYGSLLEAQGFFSRSEKRPEPKSSSTAAEPECVVEGGEVEFVRKIILDSLKFRERIRWYTSMLGKKKSLNPLKAELKKHKIRNVTTTEFCQGRTMRWGIAWTFVNDTSLPPMTAIKRLKKEKEKPPMTFQVPESYVKHITEKMTDTAKKKTAAAMRLSAVKQEVESILKTLQMQYKILTTNRCVTFDLTAHTNTWTHQRRRRREIMRKRRESEKEEHKVEDIELRVDVNADNGEENSCRETNNIKKDVETNNSKKDEVNPKCTATECCSLPSNKIVNNPVSKSTEDFKVDGKIDGCTSYPQNDKQISVDATTKRVEEEMLGNSESLCAETDNNSNKLQSMPKADVESPGHSFLVLDTPLLKCTLTIKNVNKEVVMEMQYIEGKGRVIMHQVVQYFKNQFQRKLSVPI